MMSERFLWDRFLFQVRTAELIPEGGKILDVGTGINTTVLEIFGDKWDVTPSDINVGDWNAHIPGMVQLDVNYIGERFPLEFDGIIMSEVLEHIEYLEQVLEGAYGALKMGGVLIISTPFLYRIHEYGDADPETSEPGLLDYWRFTPNGMASLLRRTNFDEFWVGRLVEGNKKNFPEWQCPKGIVAWAKKAEFQDRTPEWGGPVQIGEDGWILEWEDTLPDNWREQQVKLAEDYERRIRKCPKKPGISIA